MGSKKQRRWVPVSGLAGILVVVILAVEFVLMSGWFENGRSSHHEWLFGFLGVDYAERPLEYKKEQGGSAREERLPASEVNAVDPVMKIERSAPVSEQTHEEVLPVDDSVPVG
jgi:hypothetical protein